MKPMRTTIFLAFVFFLVTSVSPLRADTIIPSEAFTHPQQLVTVSASRRINLFCEGAGTPVVLFDSGLGDTMMAWRFVQGEVAKVTKACSYDRAGYGFSEASPHGTDARAAVEDIHSLLEAAGIVSPVIYVGHSVAGLYGTLLARIIHQAE